MSEQRILELEQQLAAAHESVANLTHANADLTLANADLTKQMTESDTRFRKLKRNARSDESSLRSQLATAQSRRG